MAPIDRVGGDIKLSWFKPVLCVEEAPTPWLTTTKVITIVETTIAATTVQTMIIVNTIIVAELQHKSDTTSPEVA